MSVQIAPSLPSPVPAGVRVAFTATASNFNAGEVWYRFRVRRQGTDFQTVIDFGPTNQLVWTAVETVGVYEIEVTTRNRLSGNSAVSSLLFEFQSRAAGGVAQISATTNSLVFLYSAPPCAAGSRIRAAVTGPDGLVQQTPYKTCQPGLSMNFYLAGLRALTRYSAVHTIDFGTVIQTGPAIFFATGAAPPGLYTDTILKSNPATPSNHILLGSPVGGRPAAHDLAGNLVWYGPDDITILTRVEAGGMWGIVQAPGQDPAHQIVRKFDLTGMTLLETNAARVNEQLAAMGKRAISSFHHEARGLPGGRAAVLAGVEQILTDTQGPGDVDVLGDMIVVLDQNLNVVWTWDAFDNLDVSRAAVLGETCPGGCFPTQLSTTGNDWTHANAIQQTPDGELLYSSRHQDWLIKISYEWGGGDGHIVWKLGKDGDFRMIADISDDPYPWFSHQHDANFVTAGDSLLLLFDDGNTRVETMQGGNSRGQVLAIDEQNRTVTRVLNTDLGVYAAALGSAQYLAGGTYHFNAGWVTENNTRDAYSFEVDGGNRLTYAARANVVLYRTFRMSDMYTLE